jgi:hypothetical protein
MVLFVVLVFDYFLVEFLIIFFVGFFVVCCVDNVLGGMFLSFLFITCI